VCGVGIGKVAAGTAAGALGGVQGGVQGGEAGRWRAGLELESMVEAV